VVLAAKRVFETRLDFLVHRSVSLLGAALYPLEELFAQSKFDLNDGFSIGHSSLFKTRRHQIARDFRYRNRYRALTTDWPGMIYSTVFGTGRHVPRLARTSEEGMTTDEIRKMLDTKAVVSVWPEAAQALDLKRGQAYRAAASGDIQTIRIGKLMRVPSAWLKQKLGLDDAKAA
jgi:hypothetical protein